MCARLSRLLLLLITVEVVTMPLTQHLWHWDGFLHGGQDFELGLLVIVVCICMALLRAQQGRRRIGLLLALRERLSGLFRRHPWQWLMQLLHAAALRHDVRHDPGICRFNANLATPLLI